MFLKIYSTECVHASIVNADEKLSEDGYGSYSHKYSGPGIRHEIGV